jgi:hypothetical protein
LATLIQAWDRLPEAIRAGILAMVEAACPEARQAPSGPDGQQGPAHLEHDANGGQA